MQERRVSGQDPRFPHFTRIHLIIVRLTPSAQKRKNMKRNLALFVAIITTLPLFSLSIFSTFSSLVEEADLIIVGQVASGKIVEDGAEYIINIKEVLKGDLSTEQIVTIQKYGIKIAMDYIFLLKKRGNIYTDFFEGATKFEIEYVTYNSGLAYCISIPTDIIGTKDIGKKN